MNYRKISEEIQSPHGRALGDCWSVVNYFINLGIERDEIIRLAIWYLKGENRKRVDKLKEVQPLFERSNMIELVELDPTVPKIHWTKGFEYPFIPTKIKWEPNNSKKICYQFDGKSHKAKNFSSPEMEQEILDHIVVEGYEPVRLGNNNSLEDCLKIMSNSEIFVGIDSGMCYLAASAGIPIIFCKNDRPFEVWDMNHSNKHFILENDYLGIKQSITKYKNGGLNYYKDNARNINFFQK